MSEAAEGVTTEMAGRILDADFKNIVKNFWQKMEGAPKTPSNGSFPMAEWREFVRGRGLKTNSPVTTNEEPLKARKLLAEVEERELNVAIKKGEFVLMEEVRRSWRMQVGNAVALLRAKFESELPPILSGKEWITIFFAP
jgi:hypothetical protein